MVLSGIHSLFRADIIMAAIRLLILTPVSIGGFVSFGLIIRYGEGE